MRRLISRLRPRKEPQEAAGSSGGDGGEATTITAPGDASHPPSSGGGGGAKVGVCEKEMWKTRWAQIIITPTILLGLGTLLVALLWFWTNQKALMERKRVLEDVHSAAIQGLGHSVSAFISIMSIYSHALDTFEMLPFHSAETMFGPMLQQANFSAATCAYFSRVTTLEERLYLESVLSIYAGRPVRFREGYNFTVLPLDQPEYWVLTHGDSGLTPIALGIDYSSVPVIMEQIEKAIK